MTTWTNEREQQLRELWGTMSASEIARDMGIQSRNVIIGKAHRMGLPTLASPIAIPKHDGRKDNFIVKNAVKRAKAKDPGIIIQDGANTLSFSPTGAKPLIDLKPRDCRWGVNVPPKGGGHLFCSAPVRDPRTVYCDQHSMLSHRTTSAKSVDELDPTWTLPRKHNKQVIL